MQHTTACLGVVLGASMLVSLPLGADTMEEDAMGQQIQIEVSGTPGVVFSAEWRVTQDGETQTYQEEGQVPADYAFEGDAIQASIEVLSEGRLDITVQKGGNRSRSSTQGKGSTLNFAVR
ncbi:hypothetical protein QC823_07790 [Halomonas vilamensis]|uniref:Uncharacterized protein n=1 Tax=Vreelandella vilamensis TaxID=531309 RepID=A0ABU1H3L3_9GAMM|nr:hypothetical protein [Halomonas vilamensis]MDR5898889.1 hypothetical protein [Halomonas vilamensis]